MDPLKITSDLGGINKEEFDRRMKTFFEEIKKQGTIIANTEDATVVDNVLLEATVNIKSSDEFNAVESVSSFLKGWVNYQSLPQSVYKQDISLHKPTGCTLNNRYKKRVGSMRNRKHCISRAMKVNYKHHATFVACYPVNPGEIDQEDKDGNVEFTVSFAYDKYSLPESTTAALKT